VALVLVEGHIEARDTHRRTHEGDDLVLRQVMHLVEYLALGVTAREEFDDLAAVARVRRARGLAFERRNERAGTLQMRLSLADHRLDRVFGRSGEIAARAFRRVRSQALGFYRVEQSLRTTSSSVAGPCSSRRRYRLSSSAWMPSAASALSGSGAAAGVTSCRRTGGVRTRFRDSDMHNAPQPLTLRCDGSVR
jgi:hypothetical protein